MDLLSKVIKSVIIHRFDFGAALEHALKLCPALGKHSGLFHFTPQCINRYIWAHKLYQPWGRKLPLQCPQCGVLNSWSLVGIQNGGYKIQCSNGGCGLVGGRRQMERHSIKVDCPSNATLIAVSKEAGWLKTSKPSVVWFFHFPVSAAAASFLVLYHSVPCHNMFSVTWRSV